MPWTEREVEPLEPGGAPSVEDAAGSNDNQVQGLFVEAVQRIHSAPGMGTRPERQSSCGLAGWILPISVKNRGQRCAVLTTLLLARRYQPPLLVFHMDFAAVLLRLLDWKDGVAFLVW